MRVSACGWAESEVTGRWWARRGRCGRTSTLMSLRDFGMFLRMVASMLDMLACSARSSCAALSWPESEYAHRPSVTQSPADPVASAPASAPPQPHSQGSAWNVTGCAEKSMHGYASYSDQPLYPPTPRSPFESPPRSPSVQARSPTLFASAGPYAATPSPALSSALDKSAAYSYFPPDTHYASYASPTAPPLLPSDPRQAATAGPRNVRSEAVHPSNPRTPAATTAAGTLKARSRWKEWTETYRTKNQVRR